MPSSPRRGPHPAGSTPDRPRAGRRRLATLALGAWIGSLVLASGGASGADEFIPISEWRGEDGLTGEQIYDRVLANRFDASRQLLSLSSKDRADHRQYVELNARYLRGEPGDDVASMYFARYPRPADVRGMGYLVINKRTGPDDQFVYLPSARSVRRINARTEAISGTDFTLEDIVPQEAEDAEHIRRPDVEHAGRSAWVVTVVPHADADSSYSKFVVTIDKEYAVPLQTDYWDDRGVRIKQLRADPRSIERFEGRYRGETRRIYIVRRSKMVHLKRESQTVLNVLDFEPDADLTVRDFSQRVLTAGH